jgi:carbonic anhydrase/acetyltransferase-like protein (isoleucine patch superfamily)
MARDPCAAVSQEQLVGRMAKSRQDYRRVARSRGEEGAMAIYELDGQGPELPAGGRYWVAESAAVIGKVRLLPDTSVWYGAVLRGDNEWIELGERSQVQDNATLHTDPGFPVVIGDNCVIGHNVVLHGCRIGGNSLIGMGAILLNGVRIGRNCLVGAGALVTEGKEFPDNSLIVGAPARTIRQVDEKTAAEIARGADIYVRRSQRYAKGLKRIG